MRSFGPSIDPKAELSKGPCGVRGLDPEQEKRQGPLKAFKRSSEVHEPRISRWPGPCHARLGLQQVDSTSQEDRLFYGDLVYGVNFGTDSKGCATCAG